MSEELSKEGVEVLKECEGIIEKIVIEEARKCFIKNLLPKDKEELCFKVFRTSYSNDIAVNSCKRIRRDLLKKELKFLMRLKKIVDYWHSQIPMVEIGRQNVRDDINHELKLDERIGKLMKELSKSNK